MYIIGVSVAGSGECQNNIDTALAEPIYTYLGWILRHVDGQVCGTEHKINGWFDQAAEEDDLRSWE